MDINELKMDPKVLDLRLDAKNKAEKFSKLCSKLSIFTRNLVFDKRQELLNQFKEYFESHSFNVTSKHRMSRTAQNDMAIIELNLVNQSDVGSTFSFEIPSKSIYKTIEVRASQDCEDLLIWQNNLRMLKSNINEINLVFNEIDKIFKLEELEVLIEALQENIDWYEATLEDTSRIEYVFGVYDESYEFNNFQEFFEEL